jgi:SpoVK/Ycf46/Vps4 family AAA+-type ATPase
MFGKKDKTIEQAPESVAPIVLPEAPEELILTPASIVTYENLDISDVYDQVLSANGSVRLINTRLPLPADDVTLNVETDGDTFDVYGTIRLQDKKRATGVVKKVARLIEKSSEDTGGTITTYRDGIDVKDQNGTRLLIAQGAYYSENESIIVSTGKLKDGYDTTLDVFESPELTKELFKATVEQTLGAMAMVLNVAYAMEENQAGRELTLRVVQKKSQKLPKTEAPEVVEELVDDEAHPKLTLNDIGGQAEAKEEIKSLAYALSHPESYRRWGAQPPKGILFEGPPGTGKTLLARVVASEADATFFPVSVTDVSSKWYGDSEKRIKRIFEQAAQAEKAIIYFDELDALSPSRNSSHEATSRVVSIILQCMDGFLAKGNVFVIASTNNAEKIDEALLRTGRFDRKLYIGLPDSEARKAIFSIHMKKACETADRQLFEEIDLDELAEAAEGISGADIKEMVRRTLEQKVRTEMISEQTDDNPVTTQDILNQLSAYKKIS